MVKDKYIDIRDTRLISEVEKTLPKKGITYIREEKKVNRNDLCKCGSGKKYKKCCISINL